MTQSVAAQTEVKPRQGLIALAEALYFSLSRRFRFERGPLSMAFLLALVISATSKAAGDPVTTFITGIEGVALGVCSVVAVLGIILAGAAYMFGSGQMGEKLTQIGVGCFVLGGASAIGTWLFGL